MQGASGIILLVVMIVVMYFLLIRPQRKREKETNAMRSSVKVGDRIITIGGLCGKVVKTKEESLIIQVGASHTRFEMMRWSVSKIVSSAEMKERDDSDVEEEPVKKAVPKRMKKNDDVEEAAKDDVEKVEDAVESVEEEKAEETSSEE